MKRTRRSIWLTCLLLPFLALQLACGTLLYPERRGQTGGRLDADVVILDAIGLLFFVIPGLFAFAVDFITGTIYLPRGGNSRVSQLFGVNLPQRLPPHVVDQESLERWLEEQLGTDIELETRLPSPDALEDTADIATVLGALRAS